MRWLDGCEPDFLYTGFLFLSFFLDLIRLDSIRLEVTGWLNYNAVRSGIAGLVIWDFDWMERD